MSRRGLLERFRPAAPPGAAGRVGVPVDSTADTALLAVLGALGPAQAEAQQIRERARAEADAIGERAQADAAAVAARARRDAAEQRAVAAARAHEAGEREGHRMTDEALVTADRIRALGRDRMPALVARVVETVRHGDVP